MIRKEHITVVNEFDSLTDFSEEEQTIIDAAQQSALNAYAPYSNFKVGACVLLENGKHVTGNNQENAAYPSGLCAERVAIYYANSIYPDDSVKAIAICAINQNGLINNPVPPCGACRQVLLETEIRFKSPIKVILIGKDKYQVIENCSQLLPLNFDKENLTL